MKLQVLVSTMNKKDYNLLNKMNIESDAIVINQCGIDSDEIIKKDNFKIKWINSMEKGLSCSRNMAIKNATEEICILADDDIEFISDYEKIILNQFELNPDLDIITFQVEGIESEFKDYYDRPRKINYLTSMKVSSVEIAFKLSSIKKANIKFNELFGSGAKYFSGEENIFLIECLKAGLKAKYVPIKISNIHIGQSTWFRGFNNDYFVAKGAGFTAMSKMFSIPLIIQFALRKQKLFCEHTTIYQSIRLMLKGRKQFLNEIK